MGFNSGFKGLTYILVMEHVGTNKVIPRLHNLHPT